MSAKGDVAIYGLAEDPIAVGQMLGAFVPQCGLEIIGDTISSWESAMCSLSTSGNACNNRLLHAI